MAFTTKRTLKIYVFFCSMTNTTTYARVYANGFPNCIPASTSQPLPFYPTAESFGVSAQIGSGVVGAALR